VISAMLLNKAIVGHVFSVIHLNKVIVEISVICFSIKRRSGLCFQLCFSIKHLYGTCFQSCF
jgi:hypothetical protein